LVFATTTGNTIIYTNTTNAPKINPSTGNVGIGIGSSTWQPARLRITTPSTASPQPVFDPFSIGYLTGYTNFKVSAFNNNTGITLNRFLSTGASASSTWISFGNPDNYDAINFAGRAYLTVNGTGTNDSRHLSFQGPGDGDAFRFYFLGNSDTVPTVGGYGLYIARNLQVNGTFSANKIKMPYGAGASFSNDTTAAAGGIALGQLYHANGTVKVRIV
jgi:hypothetical protein